MSTLPYAMKNTDLIHCLFKINYQIFPKLHKSNQRQIKPIKRPRQVATS